MVSSTENTGPVLAPPKSPWLVAFALMSAVFIFGGIVGASATLAFIWNRDPQALGPRDFPVERMLETMKRDLNLSPDQAASLKSIMTEHREQMQAIHDEVRPKVEEQMESLRADVESVLTPEQAAQWNSRFDSAWNRWMPQGSRGSRFGRGGRGGGAGYGGFRRVDANGDGVISLDEAQSVIPGLTEEELAAMDANGDGIVQQDEWRDSAPGNMPDGERPARGGPSDHRGGPLRGAGPGGSAR